MDKGILSYNVKNSLLTDKTPGDIIQLCKNLKR